MTPQPATDVVSPDSVQPRVAEEYFKIRARSGITLHDRGSVLPNGLEERKHCTRASSPPNTFHPGLKTGLHVRAKPVSKTEDLNRYRCRRHLHRLFAQMLEEDAAQVTLPEAGQNHDYELALVLGTPRDFDGGNHSCTG